MHKVGRARAYLLLAAALCIQVTIADRLTISGARPDCMLICVTFFGLFLGSYAGLEAGIVAGAFTDLFALDYFGINIFIYGLVGLISGALNTSFSKESKRAEALLVFFCTVIAMAIHYVLLSFFARGLLMNIFEFLGACALPSGIYTSIVSIPVFARLMKTYRFHRSEEFL